MQIIVIYLLSIWKVFHWTRNAYYHEKGKLFGLNPDTDDYLATFFPILNTVMALIFIFKPWKKRYSSTNIFKPKPKPKR